MSNNSVCCSFYRGSFYFADYVDLCHPRFVLGCNESLPYYKAGNVTSANLQIDSEILGKENQSHFLDYNQATRINVNSISLNINLVCSSDSNFYKALKSQSEELSGSGSEVERISCVKLIEFESYFFKRTGVDLSTVSIVAKDGSGNTLQTLIEGEDYSISQRHIEILKNIDVSGLSYVEMSYDYEQTGSKIMFDTKTIEPFSVKFKGVNYGSDSGELVDVEFYKVRFKPVDSISFLSNDFLSFELQGIVEKDYSRQNKGFDKYFYITRI